MKGTQKVYIKGSLHTPPNKDAVRDTMPVLFDMLREETIQSVRCVLGHFIFVYIHPYMDGNGRIAQFLMNVMLSSGGYDWMVIPVESREEYMSALEIASVEQNIIPFALFIARKKRSSKDFNCCVYILRNLNSISICSYLEINDL